MTQHICCPPQSVTKGQPEPKIHWEFDAYLRQLGSSDAYLCPSGGFMCQMTDPHLPGEMHVAITLRPVACGTDMDIVQEGIPAAIPVEMCYLGWQESLKQLADLVEAEIPDGA